ncbi:MAG: peptidoglycan-binding protein, partial [Gallionellaceae bacterium]|nr:peptidoglycan-binding protein [Gallionellaceae bacterium]
EKAAIQMGITSPLGVAVVYDSTVHGSWGMIRDRTSSNSGSIASLGEQGWISAYVKARHDWLSGHSRADLRATAYRMDVFQRLIDQGYWGLELPLVVRAAEISMASLNATPSGCYDGPQPGSRALALQSPLLRGLDVRLVQLGLSNSGADIKADGIFGQTSVSRIKEYQTRSGLPATGVADAALIMKLIT